MSFLKFPLQLQKNKPKPIQGVIQNIDELDLSFFDRDIVKLAKKTIKETKLSKIYSRIKSLDLRFSQSEIENYISTFCFSIVEDNQSLIELRSDNRWKLYDFFIIFNFLKHNYNPAIIHELATRAQLLESDHQCVSLFEYQLQQGIPDTTGALLGFISALKIEHFEEESISLFYNVLATGPREDIRFPLLQIIALLLLNKTTEAKDIYLTEVNNNQGMIPDWYVNMASDGISKAIAQIFHTNNFLSLGLIAQVASKFNWVGDEHIILDQPNLDYSSMAADFSYAMFKSLQNTYNANTSSAIHTLEAGLDPDIKPIVTIVVPAYNVEDFITYTLDSIFRQTFKEFNCIIVNDCSTDNTVGKIMPYVRKDNRFTIIHHKANAGLSAARNTGLRAAKTDYICFLDSDDLLMVDGIEMRINTLMNANDDTVAGAYCGSISIKEDAKTPPKSVPDPAKNIDFIAVAGACPFNANQPMFKTEILRLLGGFDEHLKQAEDYELWMRVLRSGFSILSSKKKGVTYRQRSGSMVRNDPLNHLDRSYTWHASCHRPVKQEEVFTCFNSFLSKPWADYKNQLDMTNRTLEFSGMALCNEEPLDEIAHRIIQIIPDITNIIGQHRNFTERCWIGIQRSIGQKKETLSHKDFTAFTKKIIELYDYAHDKIEQNKTQLEKIDKQTFCNDALIRTPGFQKKVDLIFLPHKDYHVWTINMIAPSLKAAGISFMVVNIDRHYRDEGVKRKAEELNIELLGYSNWTMGHYNPAAIISFNDWDPIVKSIFAAAQNADIKTVSIVEGIQDYDDVDTGQSRHAYKTADMVLLPGEFDSKYFQTTNQTVSIAGIPRVFEMREKAKNGAYSSQEPSTKVLINSNFSYGVLENYRDNWIQTAVDAVLEAGLEPVISRHPADEGTIYQEYVTDKTFYAATLEAHFIINRFASGMLEGLAMERQVIYYNPHNEQVDKFKAPMGAYPIAETKNSLIVALKGLSENPSQYKDQWSDFLDAHCGNLGIDPATAITEALETVVGNFNKESNNNSGTFRKNLIKLDEYSDSLHNISLLRETFKATYSAEGIQNNDFWLNTHPNTDKD